MSTSRRNLVLGLAAGALVTACGRSAETPEIPLAESAPAQ